MRTRFKPCPFCGCREIHQVMVLQPNALPAEYQCWCDRCGAETRGARTKAKATWLWNRRTKT
jgi:Lar family restriction alleviation protein